MIAAISTISINATLLPDADPPSAPERKVGRPGPFAGRIAQESVRIELFGIRPPASVARDLLNEARSAVAVDLLSNGLTVEQVSRRLGYSDTSTFCHAFKRWHGASPSDFLQSRSEGHRPSALAASI